MALLNDLALSSFEGRLRLRSEPTSGLGDVELNEVTAPGTPAANRIRLYAKDQSAVSALFYKNDAGTEINLSGSLTGTGVANRVAFWDGTSSLSSDADLTFLTDTLTATKVVVSNANTAGSVLFASAIGITQDNANLFWDDPNNVLRLGNNAATSLHPTTTTDYLQVRNPSTSISGAFQIGNAGTTLGTYIAEIDFGTSGISAAEKRGAVLASQLLATSTVTVTADLEFFTTNAGAIAERFRIGPVGQWGIGGATYGTAAQYFRSAGAAAAPTWATIAASEIGSGTALTKTDDTNVTLTLGGTPTTALLAAASLTLGWTGTLGVARGGTNLASYAIGDLLYASGATTLAKLADVASGSVLMSQGVGVAPQWSAGPTFTDSLTVPSIYGGNAANEDLALEGTSHATKTTSIISLQRNGGNIGIGTTSNVNALLTLAHSNAIAVNTVDGTDNGYLEITGGGGGGPGRGSYLQFHGNERASTGGKMEFGAGNNASTGYITFLTNDLERLRIQYGGSITITSLAGTGTRTVVADANGVLSTL